MALPFRHLGSVTHGTCLLRPNNSTAICRLSAGNPIYIRALAASLGADEAALSGQGLVSMEQLENALSIDQMNKS